MRSPLHPLLGLLVVVIFAMAAGRLSAQEDSGRAKMGALEVTVYFATDGDPQAAGEKAREITPSLAARLRSEARLSFAQFALPPCPSLCVSQS